MALHISTSGPGGRVVIDGTLTIRNVSALRDEIGLRCCECMVLEVDLAGVTEVDAAGLQGLASAARGARLRTSGAKQTWVDGPFSESKELIADFAILKDVTFAETKTFTERYAAILGDIEVDIREVDA